MDKELYKQIVVAIASGVVNDYHFVDHDNHNIYPLTKIGNTIASIAKEIEFQASHKMNESNEQSLDNESKDNQDSDIYICRNALDGIVIFKGKPKYNATRKEFTNQFSKDCTVLAGLCLSKHSFPLEVLGYCQCAKVILQPVKCDEIRER